MTVSRYNAGQLPEERGQVERSVWPPERRSQRWLQIGRPFNVRHNTLVDKSFQWSNVEEQFELTAKVRELLVHSVAAHACRCVAQLGEGAFGEVWKARHKELGFEIAIKASLLQRRRLAGSRASSLRCAAGEPPNR